MDQPERDLDSFQLEEYKNISTSHYETNKQISEFFKYYLIILAAPALILALLQGLKISIDDLILFKLSYLYYWLIGVFMAFVGLIGFFLYWYVINLRHDAVLYAQTVNGIRNYFYSKNKMSLIDEGTYRVLPKKINEPHYVERQQFWPVVFSFTLINTGYVFLGMYLIAGCYGFSILSPLVLSVILLILQVAFYYYLSYRRNNYYMHSYTIGVDIDGVLNKHREHFVKLLLINTGKSITSESIKHIPLHEDSSLGVSEEDEHKVFNDINYWKEMPTFVGASRIIEKLRKSFGFRIYLFSKRPWPDFKLVKVGSKINVLPRSYIRFDVKKITKAWLKKNEIQYDRFVLERGNTDISDAILFFIRRQLLERNRFQKSKTGRIKYFIEDMPDNAIKLARFCEVVFLIKHPYNIDRAYPKNIVLVDTWDEILQKIRQLS